MDVRQHAVCRQCHRAERDELLEQDGPGGTDIMRPLERRASRLVGILALVAVGVVGLLRVIAGGHADGPTTLARPTPNLSASFASSAAEEYRRRARFPRASQPLTAAAPDPIAHHRNEFGDPGLLDAAKRVEADGLVGGLQRGG